MRCPARFIALVAVSAMCLLQPGCSKDEKDKGSTPRQPAGTKASPTSTPAGSPGAAQQAIKDIESAKTPAQVKPFLAWDDLDVVKAALAKLGRIGDDQAVTVLKDALAAQKRQAGTGDEGLAAAAITALGATARPDARQTVTQTLDTYLKDGPLVQGPYSHIGDTQYYNTLHAAIAAAGRSDDPEMDKKLQAVAEDPSRFYTVREAAREAMLNRQIRREKLDKPADRVGMLLTQADFPGALAENTWSGKTPGDKTPAAIKQSVIEKLILAEGWDAARPVAKRLSAAGNDTERLATGKLLSTMIVRRLGAVTRGADVAVEKEMLRTLIEELSKAGPATMGSPTLERIFRRIQIAADALEDEDIWAKAKALHDRIKFEDAWTGSAPLKDVLGVALPPEAKFIPELSRKTATPYGIVVKASFVTTQAPEDLVKYFQDKTGQKGVFKPEAGQARAVAGGASSRAAGPSRTGTYFIPVAQTPAELSEWVNFGVTVYGSEQPYEYHPFGQVMYSGRTLFEITVKQ